MILKTYPQSFQERIVKSYALFPTIVEDKLIWLQYYYKNQYWGYHYHKHGQHCSENNSLNYWVTESKSFDMPIDKTEPDKKCW